MSSRTLRSSRQPSADTHKAAEASKRPAKKRRTGTGQGALSESSNTAGRQPARPHWTTYRVSQIPATYDSDSLHDALCASLQLEQHVTLTIHSFASKRPEKRISTITFSDTPSRLYSTGDDDGRGCTTEWKVDIVHPLSTQTDTVCIDTHFTGFTPLSPLDNDEEHLIDCIAIHGWGSHPLGGFKVRDDTYMWLRDSLAKDIPRLRVFIYGYACDLTTADSISGVDDYADTLRRLLRDMRGQNKTGHPVPLVFIAHSLGGMVLKQAFIRMKESSDSNDNRNLDSVYGALFFGVPSQGMDTEALAAMVGDKPQRYDLSLLNDQVGHRLRSRQHDDFCKAFDFKDSKIIQFFETRKTPTVVEDQVTKKWSRTGPKRLLVNPASATFGRSWETSDDFKVSIDADHSDMVKFPRFDQDGYVKARDELRKFAEQAVLIIEQRFQQKYMNNLTLRHQRPKDDLGYSFYEQQPIEGPSQRIVNEQPVSCNKHFEIPHLLSPVFTGRDEDLQRLTTSFAAGESSQIRDQRRFVLFGLGGSGKTQICLKYVQENRELYWGIFWVDASSDDRIQQCFAQIARLLEVNENIDSIKRTLANSLQAWLLIFDNADDPDLSLAPYFPAGDRGDILITSRNPQCQAYNTVGYQEVGRLSPKDSVSLLDKIIYGATSRSQEASEEDQKIVETVGHLALAIVQAGAYIRETSCSLHDYLELYKRRRRNLLQDLPKHLGTDYKRSVYATWQVTVDMIESMQDAASYSALRLLSLLGFYHHDQIPIQMFYNVQHQSQTDPVPDYLPWHESSSEDDYQQSVQASITLLASFSLITRNADASLSLHPLVHEWCRDRMFADEQLSYQRALSLLANSVHWEFETKDYTFRRSLVSHVQELLRLRDHGEVSEEQAMKQWPVLALILSESGWMTDALKLQEEITTLYRGNLGEDRPATLSSMAHLVKDYINAGRREEAQQLAEEMIVLQKSKLGVDHSTTWWLMHNLAILYNSVGRRVQALQLTEDVLKLQKNKLGEDHPDTVISMHNLAIWYCEVGRRAEARQLIEEVVNLWKSKLGEDHPNTLGSMHNLANVYSEAGRRADALQMIKEVVNLRKSKLVEDHPDTLWSMHTLAVLYSGTGRRADALQLIKEVVNMRKSKLGEDHPNTILSEGLLANLSQGTETSSTS